jgi:hypothetical protein
MNYKSIIYISHPYGGDGNNILIVKDLIELLHNEYPECLFISPIHAFGHMYDYTEYQEGLNMCLWLLDQCDEAWVFGDYESSVGCMSEIAYCQNHLIPCRIVDEPCLGIRQNPCKCHECSLVDYDEYYIKCNKDELQRMYNEVVHEYE